MNTTLGRYLKGLRKIKGYDQEYVASMLGISRQAYSHYETGRSTPPVDICYKIAELFSTSPDNLISLTVNVGSIPTASTDSIDDIQGFLSFIENKNNSDKLRYLNTMEREMIYYYSLLSPQQQTEIIEIIKVKLRLDKRLRP